MSKKEIFLDDFWAETKKESLDIMARKFEVPVSEFRGCTFIVAQYSYEDYSGGSYCLFKKDGKLYENYGSHCSCYGLEEQWEPTEADIGAILLRLYKDYHFTPAIQKILMKLRKPKKETNE